MMILSTESSSSTSCQPVRNFLISIGEDADQVSHDATVFFQIKEAGGSASVAHSSSSTNSRRRDFLKEN